MHMHAHHDHHSHRDLDTKEEPLDAANQSLADALRSSFGILKVIMMVLVVLYLASNVRCVDTHEQALHLRLGALLPGVYQPGLVWAFPFPIDEIVPLPAKSSNELLNDSHTFYHSRSDVGKSLAVLSGEASGGIDPVGPGGALLTADAGLVHARWKVTYKIDEVGRFVTNFLGNKVEAADGLLAVVVENAGIHVASEMTAEEMIRTRVHDVQDEMKRRVNEWLRKLDSGVVVTTIEMYEPTPPLQIRGVFDATQRAENMKKRAIDRAQQEKTQILSRTAGGGYQEFAELLDKIEVEEAAGRPIKALEAELEQLLVDKAEGEAGRLIREASAYHSVVVGQMQSDVELYRTLLPEYERNPKLLIARLWEQTRRAIYDNPGVTKIYRPCESEFRLKIPLDPEQERVEEERRLQQQEYDVSKLKTPKQVPLGPGYDG